MPAASKEVTTSMGERLAALEERVAALEAQLGDLLS
jgi:BMFP domain-containing protein YqiC